MTALVVGASRGLGRGIAEALAAAGTPVVAVSRSAFEPTHAGIETVVADAADEKAPERLIEAYAPDSIIVVAGAAPVPRPLQDQTWETFSVNWHADVRIAFHWVRESLRRPLPAGSRVIVISSGASVAGSPLSGGYAGAKATQRFITGYARDESERSSLGITFTAVLPRLTPLTDLGRPAVAAYAERSGLSVEDYLRDQGESLTPEGAGAAVIELLNADAATVGPAYLLAAAGLRPLP
jgi:NAD(P)-dependent dehydrogenase (short-subunit alcohol dehydrogenase family)